MTYARLTADLQAVESLNAVSDETYAAWQAANNPKTLRHRLQVIDPLPTMTATQRAVAGAWLVEATQVRQPWVVVEKTATELEAEALSAEKSQLADRIDKLKTAVDQYQALLDVPYVEPVQAATNAAEINALRARMKAQEQAMRDVYRDLILTMRCARFFSRMAKQEL